MSSAPEPLERHVFDAAELMARHAPRVHHPNKQAVLDVACPPGAVHRGRIEVSRWAAIELPPTLDPPRRDLVRAVPGFFDYASPDEPGVDEWHVNFADPNLFFGYAGRLFAQDEMQVAEHPALAAVREALVAAGAPARTVDQGRPTPILVAGVERRVSIATDPDPAAGRPNGLYGNRFAAAPADVVGRATTAIVPPTITNLVAMAALPGRPGPYAPDEIRTTLETAYTGFRAAVMESARLADADRDTTIHTGYWGCGAFGGDRVLMALLQVVAAAMAGLRRLVFHTGSAGGESPLAEATAVLEELAGTQPIETQALLDAIHARGFRWGTSDGN